MFVFMKQLLKIILYPATTESIIINNKCEPTGQSNIYIMGTLERVSSRIRQQWEWSLGLLHMVHKVQALIK